MEFGFVYPNEAEIQWSILIVIYPFITGLVAGAFIVSSFYHVFGLKVFKPVARFSLVTALAFLMVAPLPLQAHLGRPERAFEIFLTPNKTSAMAGFGYIWMFYLVLLLTETWLVFRPVQGFDWTRRLDWSRVLVPAGLFVLSLLTLFAQSFRSFLYFQF